MGSDASPPAQRFFILNKVLGGRHDTECTMVDPAYGPAHHCTRCGAIISSLTWVAPYRVKLAVYDQNYGDLITGLGEGCLVTTEFAEAFQMAGLSGFSGFHPVEVVRVRRQRRGAKPEPPPPYLYVTATYGASVDEARSRIWRTSPITCTQCRSTGIDAIDGFSLEPGSWTGCDVFLAYGCPGTLIVSERFVRFAETRAMDHMAMIPTEKYVWDPLRRYYPDGPPKDVLA